MMDQVQKLITDDGKLTVIQKHGSLVANIILIIALVVVCMSYMAHMEADLAEKDRRLRDDQEVIKMWRDSQIQSNRVQQQTDKIDEIYKKLKGQENADR